MPRDLARAWIWLSIWELIRTWKSASASLDDDDDDADAEVDILGGFNTGSLSLGIETACASFASSFQRPRLNAVLPGVVAERKRLLSSSL